MRKTLKHEFGGHLADHTSHRQSLVFRALEVEKSEYHGRDDFAASVGSGFHKTPKRFRFRCLADRSGWVVLRVK